MKLVIVKPEESIGNWIARYIIARLIETPVNKNRLFTLGFTPESVAMTIISEMVRYHEAQLFSFQFIRICSPSQYIKIPHTYFGNSDQYKWVNFLENTNMVPENIKTLNYNASDPDHNTPKLIVKY